MYIYIGCIVPFIFGHLYRTLVKFIFILGDKCHDDVIDDVMACVMVMSCGGPNDVMDDVMVM